MPAPSGNPIRDLLERADAVATRYDAFLAAARAEPHIAANHTCETGGPCVACAEHDARCLEIDKQQRQRERIR